MSAGPVLFSHADAGTPESVWSTSPRWQQVPDLTPDALAGLDALVVVAAHPDDEVLGAGGLVRTASAAGLDVHVVLLTAGEASHPHSPTWEPDALGAHRVEETVAAVALLAPGSRVTPCGLPDGHVAEHVEAAVAAVVDAVGWNGARTLVAAPWRHDGHPDHDAAGRAAGVAARRTDARLVEYPVWLWHWGGDDDVPWSELVRLPLDDAARDAKAQALAAHRTQVAPLSDRPGDEVLLSAEVLEHFRRPHEAFVVREPGPDLALDELHRAEADPWRTDTAWYEQRKRAVLLASLPRQRFGRALEVGCSVGALTEELAGRCDEVVGVDASAAALERATRRLDRLGRPDAVRVEQRVVPSSWPDGRFDLVVVSEVGYFLSPRDLRHVRELVDASLTPDGVVVLCHWRHDVVGWPLDGPTVHDHWRGATALTSLVTHVDADFLLDVYGTATAADDLVARP